VRGSRHFGYEFIDAIAATKSTGWLYERGIKVERLGARTVS
jgi:hypothetical protein